MSLFDYETRIKAVSSKLEQLRKEYHSLLDVSKMTIEFIDVNRVNEVFSSIKKLTDELKNLELSKMKKSLEMIDYLLGE